jgi:L-threonylcarbamoyladenylate synthase
MSIISSAYAVQLLQEGELVAIPTETVYGLAGRFDREDTLKQIFTVKGRPFFDPLIVHVANPKAARALTSEWPEIFDPLTDAFWPGPLTLVAPKAASVSGLITAGLPTVAVRCPRHPMTEEILNDLKIPLAAPSANLFGHTSPTSAEHVIKEFNGQVPVVDGGDCEIGVESTVLSARKTTKGKWLVEILRPGGVSRKEINDVLQTAKLNFSVERAQSQASPGHLPHHYQPSSPVVIVRAQTTDDQILMFATQQLGKKLASVAWLNLDQDARQAARTLYQAFRELSRDGQLIAIKHDPHHDGPEWEAVWDRVERASSCTFRG